MTRLLMVFEKPGEFGYLGEEYLRAFYENGWYVTVCYLSADSDQKSITQLPVHEVISLGLTKKQVHGLKLVSIYKMLKLFKKRTFDLVISHQYQANSCVGVAILFHRKVVSYAVLHGADPLTAFDRKLFYSTIAKGFMRLISVSGAQLENIIKKCIGLKRDRISVIRNTINIPYISTTAMKREQAREKFGLSSTHFVFGTICRLSEIKSAIDLVYALKEIESIIPDARLLIIGDGVQRKRILEESKRLKIEKMVILPGYIDKAWQLMKVYDLFVLPSKMESCGLVLLEAMVAKIPIIASKSPAVEETLNSVGYLFEHGNVKELSSAIVKFHNLSDKEKMRITEAGFQHVKSAYDNKIFQENILNLVNKDLSNGHCR
jgi:glycosyltransferase involved in cell wall biosynthesis